MAIKSLFIAGLSIVFFVPSSWAEGEGGNNGSSAPMTSIRPKPRPTDPRSEFQKGVNFYNRQRGINYQLWGKDCFQCVDKDGRYNGTDYSEPEGRDK